MSEIIPSDDDGVIQDEETPNEYDEVPIVDEPDEDEGENEEDESWRYQ
jgi:hypothetical protein